MKKGPPMFGLMAKVRTFASAFGAKPLAIEEEIFEELT